LVLIPKAVVLFVKKELSCDVQHLGGGGGLTSANMSSNTREVWESPEKTMTFFQISESNGEKVL
jgi:hypothetical protein